MFTGIIREVGRVRRVEQRGDTRLEISTERPPDRIELGASIACNGICFTAVATGSDRGSGGEHWFAVEASAETARCTTLGGWREGDPVNLEPAMRVGDELGGHIVSGHVDGTATVAAIRPEGDSHRLTVEAPRTLGRFLASKGSVALDGISLTVNEVEDADGATRFGVNIIPHTWSVTSLARAAEGTRLNLEVDLIARYVARLSERP
ncbi:MAG TPA: riboflavin synthase [Thermohalobaculum sp.]|nr:riboflavin synthase [Thermohalobaculum sp.]